jgi:hypothetical protein
MKIKKTILIFAIALFIVCCEENGNKNSFNTSDLVGRWEFAYQMQDGIVQTIYPDQYCKYDQVYEFFEDGTVTSNDPCQMNNFAESKANWRMEDDKLFIDYYVIPGVSVNPVVVNLTKDELVLQQMYGDVVVVQNVFRKTTKNAVDYAADAEGTYTGWMNYSSYYISDTFRGDSIPTEITIAKSNWGNISVEYRNIDVLGSLRTIQIQNVQTGRNEEQRTFRLSDEYRSKALFISPDSIFDVQNSGGLSVTNRDSIQLRLNFSRIELQDPNNISSPSVEKFYQYQLFQGVKIR